MQIAQHLIWQEAGPRLHPKKRPMAARLPHWPAVLLVTAVGFVLGMLLGYGLRLLAALPLPLAYIGAGGGLFFAALAWFSAFSRQERQHELLLAGYEAKEQLYLALVDLILAGGEGDRPRGAGALDGFLADYGAEFYVFADAKVISAVDAWLAAIADLAAPAGSRRLAQCTKGLLQQIKEDLGQGQQCFVDSHIAAPLLPQPVPAPLLRRWK